MEDKRDVRVCDKIITPFVEKRIKEGYTVVKEKGSNIDAVGVCPKCKSVNYYHFVKDNGQIKECPYCYYSELTNIKYNL